jgi:hypothetical protein
MLVKQELKNPGHQAVVLELCMVELPEDISAAKLEQLKKKLHQSGLDIREEITVIPTKKAKQIFAWLFHFQPSGKLAFLSRRGLDRLFI